MIRFLLIVAVVMAGIWLWRISRQSNARPDHEKTKSEPPALDMERCKLCALHFPAVDGVQGKKGWYCSIDHRRRAEP